MPAVRELTSERGQRQHHPAVRDRHVQGGRRSFPRPASRSASRGARTSRAFPRLRASSSAASTPGSTRAIDARVKAGDAESRRLPALRGKVAIANAKLAYQYYLELIASDRWQALAAKGARPQRLLWASTGTKDAAYSDVLYVETLIGRDTINTMPPKTIDAFLDHGVTSAIADGGHRGRAPGPVRGGTPRPGSRGRDGRFGRRGRRQIRGCPRRPARGDRQDALRHARRPAQRVRSEPARAFAKPCRGQARTGSRRTLVAAAVGGRCDIVDRAGTRIDGSAGWQRAAAPPWTWKGSANSPPKRGNIRTSCCSAWADRASAPK